MMRVGMVCVHGIGIQAKGAMAQDVKQAIELGVDELGGRIESIDAVDRQPEDPVKHHLIVDIPGAERISLDIYEAWWDQLVEPPKFSKTLAWLVRIVPFIVTATVGSLISDFESWREANEPASQSQDRLLTESALPMLASMVVISLFYIALPLVVLANLFPKVGAATRNVVTRVLGDAWLYKSGACEARVIPYIENILEHASQDSDVTVLLGHSQGAELSRLVAARTSTDLDICISVGSGTLPLGVLRALSIRTIYVAAMIAFWLALPAAVTLMALGSFKVLLAALKPLFETVVQLVKDFLEQSSSPWQVRQGPSIGESMLGVMGAFAPFIVVLVIVAIMWLANRVQRNDDYYSSPTCQTIAIKSPLDPVSFGSFDEQEILRYIGPSRRVVDWAAEHTTYFRKAATGRIILEAILGSDVVANDIYRPKVAGWFKILSAVCMPIMIGIFLAVGGIELNWVGLL